MEEVKTASEEGERLREEEGAVFQPRLESKAPYTRDATGKASWRISMAAVFVRVLSTFLADESRFVRSCTTQSLVGLLAYENRDRRDDATPRVVRVRGMMM